MDNWIPRGLHKWLEISFLLCKPQPKVLWTNCNQILKKISKRFGASFIFLLHITWYCQTETWTIQADCCIDQLPVNNERHITHASLCLHSVFPLVWTPHYLLICLMADSKRIKDLSSCKITLKNSKLWLATFLWSFNCIHKCGNFLRCLFLWYFMHFFWPATTDFFTCGY